MTSFFSSLLHPLEVAVAWIMVTVHSGLVALGLPSASGWTWAFSIVGLVVVIRIILIPLFVKQIKASRGMALLQPEMKKIQAKYKGRTDAASREAQSKETMELYRSSGTNPFASCLPILLQTPIFFALFRVLNSGIRSEKGIGALTAGLAHQAGESTLFGVKLTDTFLGSGGATVKVLAAALIVLMSVTSFTTQRQLMLKNMPASALDNPFAQQQKIILYLFPVIFAVSGVNFPIGVLLYWLTTNLWTGAQQFYVIRRMPTPGSRADLALQARRARHGSTAGSTSRSTSRGTGERGVAADGAPIGRGSVAAAEVPAPEAPVRSGQRVQPKRKDRARPGGSGQGSTRAPAPRSRDAGADRTRTSD